MKPEEMFFGKRHDIVNQEEFETNKKFYDFFCETFDLAMEEIKNHKCVDKKIIACDHRPFLGWHCSCGYTWGIHYWDLKKSFHQEGTMKSRIEEKCIKFEKEHGSIEFVRACLTVLNSVLVEKKIITEQELREKMIKELEKRSGL